VLEFVLRQKDRIPRCETLSIHSNFLGPEATCGVQKKSDELSNFVADNLLLYFLQNPSLSGHKKFEEFLCKHGISLAPKGVITSNLTSNKQMNRFFAISLINFIYIAILCLKLLVFVLLHL